MFTVISFVGWIRIVVALVALFFAAVNIKDYFWEKEGISFTIADEKKPGIYRGCAGCSMLANPPGASLRRPQCWQRVCHLWSSPAPPASLCYGQTC